MPLYFISKYAELIIDILYFTNTHVSISRELHFGGGILLDWCGYLPLRTGCQIEMQYSAENKGSLSCNFDAFLEMEENKVILTDK